MNLGLSRTDRKHQWGFPHWHSLTLSLAGRYGSSCACGLLREPHKDQQELGPHASRSSASPGAQSCVWCSAKDGACSSPGVLSPSGHKQIMRGCWRLLHGSPSASSSSSHKESLQVPFLSRKSHFAVGEGSPKSSLAMNCLTSRIWCL